MRETSLVVAMVLSCCLGNTFACWAADQPKTGEKRDTLLYIRTVPPGAKILLDGNELGTSDDLFAVKPGVGKIVIELPGHETATEQVTIQANRVTRLELILKPQAEAGDQSIRARKRRESSNAEAAPPTIQPLRATRVHLPDADTKDAEVVLDLASGQTLKVPLDAKDLTVFTRLRKGDLFFDRMLGCLRGGSAKKWDGIQFVEMLAADRKGDATAYKLPSMPCRLLITTAEKKHFDVTVFEVTDKGGINLEYRPADPAVAVVDKATSTGQEKTVVTDEPRKVAMKNLRAGPGKITEGKESPPKQDMQKYLSDTQEMVGRGRYKEALERFLWFHKHALEHDPAMTGVRLSFVLSYWKSLGDLYPPAKVAMIETRDRAVEQVADKGGNASLFQEVAALNRTLEENQETVELFQQLDQARPEMAKQCWVMAKDAVIAAKRYDLVRKYIGNPLREFARVKETYDRNTTLYNDQRFAGAHFKAYNEDSFVEESLKLIEVALALGEEKAAKEIQEKAQAVVEDHRLRDAIPAPNQRIQDKPLDRQR